MGRKILGDSRKCSCELRLLVSKFIHVGRASGGRMDNLSDDAKESPFLYLTK
jgi:hypothetical protein